MAFTKNTEELKKKITRYSQLSVLIALVKPRTIIEVGTHRATSAVAMCVEALRHRSKVHYVGFDVFETKGEDFHKLAFNGKGMASRELAQDRLAAITSQFPSFTFELIEGETSSTLHNKKLRADFVFIDGDHRVSVIEHDYVSVRRSRVVVFDDFFDPNSTQGRELIGEFGCNRLVAALNDVSILPLTDSFPNTGPIRMAVKVRRSPFQGWSRL